MQKPIAGRTGRLLPRAGFTTEPPVSCIVRPRSCISTRRPRSSRRSGLTYSGSPFRRDAAEIYLLRWPAVPAGPLPHPLRRAARSGDARDAGLDHRARSVPRQRLRSGGRWAGPSPSFKVDSIRLPHGAQMWRLTSDGRKTLIAPPWTPTSACGGPARGVDSEAVWESRRCRSSRRRRPSRRQKPATGPENSASSADPSDDPLDPRWRGSGPSRHKSIHWYGHWNAARNARPGRVSVDARRNIRRHMPASCTRRGPDGDLMRLYSTETDRGLRPDQRPALPPRRTGRRSRRLLLRTHHVSLAW